MKKYKGSMKFPLSGAETKEEFYATTTYEGDFMNPRKRFQIFKRPRRYKIDIVLVGVGDIGIDVTEVSTPHNKISKEELAQLLKTTAIEQLQSLDSKLVNIHRSYFKIQVL